MNKTNKLQNTKIANRCRNSQNAYLQRMGGQSDTRMGKLMQNWINSGQKVNRLAVNWPWW